MLIRNGDTIYGTDIGESVTGVANKVSEYPSLPIRYGVNDVIEKNELSRSDYAESYFHTDRGEPFRLGPDRKYFLPIYNVDWPTMVITASRQAEKSTFLKNDMLTDVFNNHNDSVMYATALIQHLHDFSRMKISKQFYNNPVLYDEFLSGPNVINNVKDKYLANGSSMYFRAIGDNPESARGIPARKLLIDELQSIASDNIPVIMEVTQSYKEDARYRFSGTPLTMRNNLSQMFRRSKRYEWIITCKHCYRKNKPLGTDHIDPKKPYLFCQHCGKQMRPGDGKWVSQNPDGKYPGFRICRLMTPTARWRTRSQDGILDKLDGPNAYPYYRFLNEVLGLDSEEGVVPITEEELYSLATPDISMIDPMNPPDWVVMLRPIVTIDWAWNTNEGGQAYTIFAMWVRLYDRLLNIYSKRFIGKSYENPDNVLNEIVRDAIRCNAIIIASDFGVGHKENIRIRSMVKERMTVVEIMYTASLIDRLAYDHKARCYKIGRNVSLDKMFVKAKQKLYQMPRLEESKTYLEDVLNIFGELDETTGKMRYDHNQGDPDDFAHLMNYAQAIFEMTNR